jgi:phosphohistidine phosphatase
MDLILLRHAEADFGEDDMQRPLTAKGQKQARRMGEWLNSQLPESCRIIVSPALRAVQTADALGRKYKIHPGLAPGASHEQLLQVAHWPSAREPVLIVGHQPTLGLVCSFLLSGSPQYWNVRQANAWWFVQREAADPEGLSLRAVMSPELV